MSSKDYNIACEADSSEKNSGHLVWIFVLLGVLLFATIGGLTIMFRFQVDYEKKNKIGEVYTNESLDAKAMADAQVAGKIGLFVDKKFVPVEQAMQKFLYDSRR